MLNAYRRTWFALLVAGVVVPTAAGPASAAPVRLEDLVEQQGTITQGDKRFSNFSFSEAEVTGGISTDPVHVKIGDILVKGISKPGVGLEHGLRFTLPKPTITFTVPPPREDGGAAGGSFSFEIGYDAKALAGGLLINGWTTAFKGSCDSCLGIVIRENVIADDGSRPIEPSTVDLRTPSKSKHFPGRSPGPEPQLTLEDFPAERVSIKSEISFDFAEESGTVTLNSIDETLSQVPEPTTLLLWGTTMAGLGLVARWRRGRHKQQP